MKNQTVQAFTKIQIVVEVVVKYCVKEQIRKKQLEKREGLYIFKIRFCDSFTGFYNSFVNFISCTFIFQRCQLIQLFSFKGEAYLFEKNMFFMMYIQDETGSKKIP